MRPDLEKRPREQLLALYEIGRAINSTLELEDVLDRILEMTLGLFHAEAGSIMLRQDDVLTIAVARGLTATIVAETRVPIGEGIAGWVAQTGEMIRLDGKVDDPRFVSLVEREDNITSSLCAPLLHRSQVVGVLMLRRGGETTFTPDQLDFLASVADQAAIALENARLYAEEIKRSKELELERQKLEMVLASMADGVVVCHPDGEIRRHNQMAGQLLGWSQEAVGQKLPELCPSLPFEHLWEQVNQEGTYVCDLRSADTTLRIVATALRFQDESPEGLVALFHDETERARVEKMKSEFLSMVSHELKTPITTIQAFAELMLYRDFPEERKRKFLQICLTESQRLQKLIEEILGLSRLEAGQFAFHKVPCRLDELARSLLPGFVERSASHDIQLKVHGDLPTLELDPTLMTQALSNLVSNAIKYSPDGGPITIELGAEPERILVCVRDQGIGIPEDKIPFVFEKFFRVDNSLTRKTGGTGLGLANCRYIVEGHGGTIWVESQPDLGSRFSFTLPCPPSAPGGSDAQV
ncbi:MAG: ATP-binding protein [Vulcanimicrobiota bacterium]